MHYFYLALAILGEVIGTSFLKATEDFTKLWPSLVVVFGYGAAFYFLTLSLKVIPVGIAYATWSGAGTAASVAIGVLGRYTKQMPCYDGPPPSALLSLLTQARCSDRGMAVQYDRACS